MPMSSSSSTMDMGGMSMSTTTTAMAAGHTGGMDMGGMDMGGMSMGGSGGRQCKIDVSLSPAPVSSLTAAGMTD